MRHLAAHGVNAMCKYKKAKTLEGSKIDFSKMRVGFRRRFKRILDEDRKWNMDKASLAFRAAKGSVSLPIDGNIMNGSTLVFIVNNVDTFIDAKQDFSVNGFVNPFA